VGGSVVEIAPAVDKSYEGGFFKLDVTEVVLICVGTPARQYEPSPLGVQLGSAPFVLPWPPNPAAPLQQTDRCAESPAPSAR
jgi:hypothetical protein